MFISDSHEFIFLHMRKVAGTSMRDILGSLCIPRKKGRLAHLKSRAMLEWDYQKYAFPTHAEISVAQRRMPREVFERYFKFTFVRNPWDRLVSEYEFLLRKKEHGRHGRVKKLGGFKQFIKMQIPRRTAYQINMICDRKGVMVMDFVGKFENLHEDWKTVCHRIGIPHQELPRKNITTHKRYQDYYDNETQQMVRKHWAREIDLFSYSFDS
jgi:hypothetical protein